jgi:prepilin-type processing-associated H-X9-DG protein
VYENPQFARRHLNILYVDGHIEMVELGAIQKEVVRTYENLNRPIPPEEAVRLGLGPAPQTSPAEK